MAVFRDQRLRSEDGYALIAAVVSIVLFSLMALAVMNATRGPTLMVSAEVDRARLQAAADAGVALAIQRLTASETGQMWRADGRARRGNFAGYDLDIRIEDERGKVPLNLINKQEAERLFAALGLQGSELLAAVDGFFDWRDQDDDIRPFGGEREAYAERRIRPRDGDLRTLGELGLIKGIGPDLALRMAPFVTVNFGTGEFDPRNASPLAARVMADDEADAGLAEADAPIVAGQVRRAFRQTPSATLAGRPMTIVVTASDGERARARRSVIIELTGAPTRPYVIRGRE